MSSCHHQSTDSEEGVSLRMGLGLEMTNRLHHSPYLLPCLFPRLGSTLQTLFSSEVTKQSNALDQHSASTWRQAVLDASVKHLPLLCEDQLGALMVAVIKLELHPPVAWVQACLAEVSRRLASFNQDSMIPIVWSMGIMMDQVKCCQPELAAQIFARAYSLSGSKSRSTLTFPPHT